MNTPGTLKYLTDTDETGAYRIPTEPMPGDVILAVHLCGQPIPAAWTQPLPQPSEPSTDTEVPF